MLLFTFKSLSTCTFCGLRRVVSVFHVIAQLLPALMLRKVVFIKKKKVIYFVSKQLIKVKLCCPYLIGRPALTKALA